MGLRILAETLIEEAEEKGLKIVAQLQEGFNQHLLTRVGKEEMEQSLVILEEPVSSWRKWFRFSVLTLAYGIFDALRSR